MRHLLVRGFAAAVLIVALPGCAPSEDVVELRLGHWVPAGHPMAEYLDSWAEELEAASDGRLHIDVFPGGQLGPVTDEYDMVRRGVVDIGLLLHSANSDRFPLTGLIGVPFTVETSVQGTRVLNDPELRELYLDAEHRGLKVLYLFTNQPAQIHTADTPVTEPADLEGLRIRFPSTTAKRFLDEMGADSVGLPPSGIAEAMQLKVIDGVMIDYGGAGVAYQLGGMVGHITEVYAYVSSFAVVMNPSAWDGLPEDLQLLITESVEGVEDEIGAIWDGLDAPGKQALIDSGAEIHVPGGASMEQFHAVGVAVAEEMLSEDESSGLDARGAYDLMLELAERHQP